MRRDVPVDRGGASLDFGRPFFWYPWEREFWWVFCVVKFDTKEKKEGSSGWEMEKKIIMVGMPPLTVAILPEFWQRMADLKKLHDSFGVVKHNRRINWEGFCLHSLTSLGSSV